MTAPRFQCLACKGVYFDSSPEGGIYHHVCSPLLPDQNGVEAERTDLRDENVAVSARGRVTGIQSEGAGVKCLTDPKLTEPAWITAMNKRIAEEEEE